MFRKMRRKNQQLSFEQCQEVLNKGLSGVLALSGDDGYPYAVPISFVYDNDCLYFHCAKSGHKIDAVKRNPKASFCIIDKDMVVPHEYTTYYRSVIVFGTIEIIENQQQIRCAIEKLALKYAPNDSPENRQVEIRRDWDRLCMLKMNIDNITGKQAKELVK